MRESLLKGSLIVHVFDADDHRGVVFRFRHFKRVSRLQFCCYWDVKGASLSVWESNQIFLLQLPTGADKLLSLVYASPTKRIGATPLSVNSLSVTYAMTDGERTHVIV